MMSSKMFQRELLIICLQAISQYYTDSILLLLVWQQNTIFLPKYSTSSFLTYTLCGLAAGATIVSSFPSLYHTTLFCVNKQKYIIINQY